MAALPVAAPAAARHRLQVGEGTIDVSITGQPPVPEEALLHWIDTSARAVAAYFGRYPVPRVELGVRAGGGGGVGGGGPYGGRMPTIRINVGRATSEHDLRDA